MNFVPGQITYLGSFTKLCNWKQYILSHSTLKKLHHLEKSKAWQRREGKSDYALGKKYGDH